MTSELEMIIALISQADRFLKAFAVGISCDDVAYADSRLTGAYDACNNEDRAVRAVFTSDIQVSQPVKPVDLLSIVYCD